MENILDVYRSWKWEFKLKHPHTTSSRSTDRFKGRFSKYSFTQKIQRTKWNHGQGGIFGFGWVWSLTPKKVRWREGQWPLRPVFTEAQVLGDWPTCLPRLKWIFLRVFPISWHVAGGVCIGVQNTRAMIPTAGQSLNVWAGHRQQGDSQRSSSGQFPRRGSCRRKARHQSSGAWKTERQTANNSRERTGHWWKRFSCMILLGSSTY